MTKGLTIARLLCAIILMVLVFTMVFTVKSTFAQTTHYISKSLGSDSNNGTSKSTPWGHLPGMPSCTGNCAAYSPVAGDQFILYGGDTWVASDLGINFFPWAGTSGNPIYIGVDKTWFTGSSWTRPIFNCQNTTCTLTGGSVVWIYGNYVTIDNIELTGYKNVAGAGAALVGLNQTGDIVSNFYIHGWSRDSTVNHMYAISANIAGSQVHDNVIDGSDSPNQDFMGGVLHAEQLYNNVIRYVYNGTNGLFNIVHDNLVEYNYVAADGDHCNMMNVQAPMSGTTAYAYNNVIRNAGCPGGVVMFILSNTTCSCTTYEFNNVLYNNDISSGGGPGNGTHTPTGTYYDFSNTAQTDATNCAGNGDPSDNTGLATSDYGNFHCISSITPLCLTTSAVCNNQGGNLQQALTAANKAGYASSETYAYSPPSSGSPTVGAGLNNTSLCGTIAGSNATAGTACQLDTTYPEYNTTSHTVTFRSPNARPTSAAWDVGAYQYAGAGTSPTPAAPANVTVVVQ